VVWPAGGLQRRFGVRLGLLCPRLGPGGFGPPGELLGLFLGLLAAAGKGGVYVDVKHEKSFCK